MKLEWTLIKDILAHAESIDNGEWLDPPEINGYTPTQVMYHIKLCGQAEFLEVEPIPGFGHAKGVMMKSLTWKGHIELERLRGN